MGYEKILASRRGRETQPFELFEAPGKAAPRPADGRLRWLAAAMVAIVAFRLAPYVVDMWHAAAWPRYSYVTAARRIMQTFSVVDRVGLALVAWPLLVAIALWWRRSAALAKASALALSALAADRVLSLILGFALRGGPVVEPRLRIPYVGARSWLVALAVLVILTIIEVLVAAVAWRIHRDHARGRARKVSPAERRRAAAGRMAVAGSLACVALAVGLESWEGYLRVLEAYPWVRRSILLSDRANRPRFEGNPVAQQASGRFDEATLAVSQGKYRDARNSYFRSISLYERLLEQFPGRRIYRAQLALGANNLAWLLATCPDREIRSPKRAVELAQRAVELLPEDGNSWNTLAVAHYHAGQTKDALKALDQAMRLRDGGDSFDWFFLAMIRAEAGDDDAALGEYSRAVAWMERFMPRDPELRRFCAEAAAHLGIDPPPEPNGLRGGMRTNLRSPVFQRRQEMLRALP